jgi:hypothetical protein
MPTLGCRDFGIDCDWFIHHEDPGVIIQEDFKHVDAIHPKLLQDMMEHNKVWQIIETLRKMMKN